MVSKYIINVKMIFTTAAARNEWYTKVKTAITNAKASSAAFETAYIDKDEQQIYETSRETL